MDELNGYVRALTIAIDLRRERRLVDAMMLSLSKIFGIAKIDGNELICQEIHETLIEALGRDGAAKIEEIGEAYITLMRDTSEGDGGRT